jgi:hypothetical protein
MHAAAVARLQEQLKEEQTRSAADDRFCLLSICCLLSAVCCLLSAVCRLLSAV